jgi:formin-binding protein 1
MSSGPVISPISPQVTSPASSAPRQNPVRHIAAAPPPSKYVSSPIALPSSTGGSQKAKVLFKYDATSTEELSVKPSDVLTILEPDDGSGWILGKVGRDEGLVPASYVEIQTAEAPKKGPPVAPRRGAKKTEEPKKKYFRAMYDYDASTELELSIREGDMVVMVAEDKGDGWTEVEMKGKVGSVPSNYIEAVNK